MRYNVVNILFATLLSLLMAYVCYTLCDKRSLQMIVSIGAFVPMMLTTTIALGGVSTDLPRTNLLIRLFASLMMSISATMNIIFALTDFSVPWFVILNSFLLIFTLLITVNLVRQEQ